MTRTYTKEMMKNYSLTELKRNGSLKLTLGEILTIKNLAIRHHFETVADKCREAEKKLLKPKKKKTL